MFVKLLALPFHLHDVSCGQFCLYWSVVLVSLCKGNSAHCYHIPLQRGHYQNIATGETPPVITPFHFFGYSNLPNFYH